jgi:flavodoxin
MKVAIVYDSSTGKTKAAAEQMGEATRAAGHDCTVESVNNAETAAVTAADAICVGSWTKGLYVVFQGPTKETLGFINRLGSLGGKRAAVFTTYQLAVGRTLQKMAAPLEAKGASVTGEFKSRGPHAAEGFAAWLDTLEPTA